MPWESASLCLGEAVSLWWISPVLALPLAGSNHRPQGA